MTEYDTIIKLWSPVFETLFHDTNVILIWYLAFLFLNTMDDDD